MIPVEIELRGAAEMVRALRKIDPDFRKEVGRDFRAAMKPAQLAVRSAYPTTPPLSGMTRGRLAYTSKTRGGGVGIKTTGYEWKRTAWGYGKSWYLGAITQNNPAGVIVDMAGRRGSGKTLAGQNLISVLNARYGTASRFIYPTLATQREPTLRAFGVIMAKVLGRLEKETR